MTATDLPTDTAPPRPPRARITTALKVVLSASVATALIVWAMPHAIHASWSDIGGLLQAIPAWQLGALGALWLLGLCVQTIALTAAMPGLTYRRALLLNLSGSFISNLLPLGGAAGTVLNYTMSRGWGFRRVEFARYAMLTTLWDMLVKLALPALAVAALAGSATGGGSLLSVGLWCLLAFAVLAALVRWLLTSDRAARAIGRTAGRAVRRVRHHVDPLAWERRAGDLRADTSALVADAWGRLTVGKAAYAVLQAVLLWACLEAVGVHVDVTVVLAAYAVDRVLSLAVLTPGGVGFVEVGMAGVLVAMGAGPAGAAAGILLFRGFTFLMEIPVGGLATAWWSIRGRHLHPAPR